jgi:Uncharacterised nucleotidyltransferase
LNSKNNPQYIILFHHFRLLLEDVEKENIDIAPLKGAHLLSEVYPVGEDRGKLSDVDFLVRPADFERVGQIMEGRGFVPRKTGIDEGVTHERGYWLDVGDGRKILFELHRNLVDPARFPIDQQSIWARSRASIFDGVPCRRIAEEDHFVFVALHAVMHRLTELEKSQRDLELMIRKGDTDLSMVVARAKEWKVTRIVWLALELLKERCAGLELARFAQPLEPPIAVQIAVRILVPDARQTALAGYNHRLQAAILWPCLFDSLPQLARFTTTHPLLRTAFKRFDRTQIF